MTMRLYGTLAKRDKTHDQSKPWVFWGRPWHGKTGELVENLYQDRKRSTQSLCRKARVK
jgi:hypothetical protein